MRPLGEVVLRKVLTRNDVGTTGSHQVGIHIPKDLARYMPPLDESSKNPECAIDVTSGGISWRWRYIHYNGKIIGDGTRDEYRLLHLSAFMRLAEPQRGDTLELVITGTRALEARITRQPAAESALVLVTAGPWRVLRLARAG